jgi:predicted DNA binding protein
VVVTFRAFHRLPGCTRELTIHRPLTRHFAIEGIIMEHPSIMWRSLFCNLAAGRASQLRLVEGRRKDLAAFKRDYVEQPPSVLETLEVVRDAPTYLMLFVVERSGDHPLDVGIHIEKVLGPRTAATVSKSAEGVTWRILTANEERVPAFLEAVARREQAFQDRVEEAVPRYKVTSYISAGQIGSFPASLGLREISVLTAAIRGGYYDRPRRMTVADLGRRLRMPTSTVQYVLRGAERKVMQASLPALDDQLREAHV